MNGVTCRMAVAGNNGVFAVGDVEVGRYEFNAHDESVQRRM